jgi:hypothetical protein
MIPRIIAVTVTAWLLVTTGPAAAEDSDITFQVPLNLTQLAADISKVAVTCVVIDPSDYHNSPYGNNTLGMDLGGIPVQGGVWGLNKLEVPVVGGEVHTTGTVVITVSDTQSWHPADHIGKGLLYYCSLKGFSSRLQSWDFFSETQVINAFRVSPTPEPIQSPFTW